MTNHQPVDARAGAWIGAMDRIDVAQKLKMDPDSKTRVADPLPELYWATLAEAAILAELAAAPGPVGYVAGGHLADRADRAEEHRRMLAAAIAKHSKATQPPMPDNREQFAATAAGRLTAGDHVRVLRGDWAGRTGSVIAVYQHNDPPVIDVRLDRTEPAQAWATICVLPADVELIGHRAPDGVVDCEVVEDEDQGAELPGMWERADFIDNSEAGR